MEYITFSDMRKCLSRLGMLGFSENLTYNINEKTIIVVIKNGLLCLIDKNKEKLPLLEEEIMNNVNESKLIEFICKNMSLIISNKDYSKTNKKMENNIGLLNISGNVGFLCSDLHVNLDVSNKFNYQIPSNYVNNNDLYFIVKLED